jgi:hypothetical protein
VISEFSELEVLGWGSLVVGVVAVLAVGATAITRTVSRVLQRRRHHLRERREQLAQAVIGAQLRAGPRQRRQRHTR